MENSWNYYLALMENRLRFDGEMDYKEFLDDKSSNTNHLLTSNGLPMPRI